MTENCKIVDIVAARKWAKLFSEINESYELERIIVQTIEYMVNLRNKFLFHGDIKPDNIFIYQGISTDCGTLIKLDENDPDKKYFI